MVGSDLGFVGVWVVGVCGAGTVSHMGGRSRLPMWLVVVGCSVTPCGYWIKSSMAGRG